MQSQDRAYQHNIKPQNAIETGGCVTIFINRTIIVYAWYKIILDLGLPGLQGNFLFFPSVVHELLRCHNVHDNTAVGINMIAVSSHSEEPTLVLVVLSSIECCMHHIETEV